MVNSQMNSWQLKKLEDICEVRKGQFDPKKEPNTIYIGLEHIEQQTGRLLGTGDSSETTSIKSIFKTGDVLFGKLRPYLRKYWLATFDGVCATEILPLVTKKGIDSKFLFYIIQQDKFINYLDQKSYGTKMPRTSWKEMAEYNIMIPPLSEQRKIAAILSSVDEAIEKTEAIIEQTEKVKKGLMQQLLTKGIGHTKFKKTEIGEIPEEWEVKRLDEIAKVSGGKRLPKGKSLTSVKNDHPYIRVADMQEDGISLENIQYVPTDVAKSIRRYTVNAGDIYISVAGTLGLVGIVPPELDGANLTENADRISNIKCNNIFLKYVLQSDLIQSIIEREKTISAQPKLALTRIKGFLIPIPSVEEQKKIADILLAVEKKLKSEKQKHVQLLLIKKGLMQVLLTGKVRVKVDDEVVSS
jgi:type I restriction enzyme, S subunit